MGHGSSAGAVRCSSNRDWVCVCTYVRVRACWYISLVLGFKFMMKIDLKIFHCLGGADPSSRRLSASWGNCHLCPDLHCFWTPQVLPAGCYLSGSAYQHNRRSEVTFMKCGFYYFYYLSFFYFRLSRKLSWLSINRLCGAGRKPGSKTTTLPQPKSRPQTQVKR